LSKSIENFLKKLTEEKVVEVVRKNANAPELKSIRDQMDQKSVSLLIAGAVLKKHCNNAAPRKRHVKFTDDLDALISEVSFSVVVFVTVHF
jgi:hypothetical protein